MIFWFEKLIWSLLWDICNDNFLLLRTKITVINAIKNYLISLIINLEYHFYDNELCIFLVHILFLWIHLRGYLMIKMVHNIYGNIFSLFIDMSSVSIVERIHVKSTSSSVFTKYIPLSSHEWWIISAEFLWNENSPLLWNLSTIYLLILTLNSVFINFCKVINLLY